MKKLFRIFLFGSLALILLAACASQEGTPTPGGTTVPGTTGSPPPIGTETTMTAGTETTGTAATSTTQMAATANMTQTAEMTVTETAGTPVTAEVNVLECQFCIQGTGNAVLVMSEEVVFDTVPSATSVSTPGPDTGCKSVDKFGGQQIVVCRGEPNTSLTLSLCIDGNCSPFEVQLQPCTTTGTPGTGLTETPGAGLPTPTATGPTVTPAVGSPTATPTP